MSKLSHDSVVLELQRLRALAESHEQTLAEEEARLNRLNAAKPPTRRELDTQAQHLRAIQNEANRVWRKRSKLKKEHNYSAE